MRYKRGFTIVELVVVVGIIATLAAIGFISYLGSQARTRDAQRRTDINTIASTLTLYRADHKAYPNISVTRAGCVTRDFNNCLDPLPAGAPPAGYLPQEVTDAAGWDELDGLINAYISSLPLDPRIGVATGNGLTQKLAYYYYDSDVTAGGTCTGTGHCYTLLAPTETDGQDNTCQFDTAKANLGDVTADSKHYICVRN